MKSSLTAQFLSCHYSAASNSEDSTQFNSSAPKLMSWQAGVSKLESTRLKLTRTAFFVPFITPRHEPRRKHGFYLLVRACLLTCCFSKEVLLLRTYTSAGMCLPSRCLAMGLYAKIYKLYMLKLQQISHFRYL
jgi:hypothetical protein